MNSYGNARRLGGSGSTNFARTIEKYMGPNMAPYMGPNMAPYMGPNMAPYMGPNMAPYMGSRNTPLHGGGYCVGIAYCVLKYHIVLHRFKNRGPVASRSRCLCKKSCFFIKLPQYSVRIVFAFQAPPVFPLSHMASRCLLRFNNLIIDFKSG